MSRTNVRDVLSQCLSPDCEELDWNKFNRIYGRPNFSEDESVKEKNENGNLPLHFAARYGAPSEVTLALLEAHRAGAVEKDDKGCLPLLLAARHGAPSEVTLALLEAHRAGARAKTKDGYLPLHYAARHGAPSEVVSALLEAHRAGAREAVGPGEFPLHLALEGVASDEVIEILLKEYPTAASTATTAEDDDFAKEFGDTLPLAKGSLPLHIASRRGKPVRVIKLLSEAYPQAVDIADANGETPDEVAGMAQNYREIIETL